MKSPKCRGRRSIIQPHPVRLGPDTVIVYGGRKGLTSRTLRILFAGDLAVADFAKDGRPDLTDAAISSPRGRVTTPRTAPHRANYSSTSAPPRAFPLADVDFSAL